jgi:hypothetical protein
MWLADWQVARALLTGSSVFQKHAAKHLGPIAKKPMTQKERTMALLDTWVAVEDELETRKPKPKSWKQGR